MQFRAVGNSVPCAFGPGPQLWGQFFGAQGRHATGHLVSFVNTQHIIKKSNILVSRFLFWREDASVRHVRHVLFTPEWLTVRKQVFFYN